MITCVDSSFSYLYRVDNVVKVHIKTKKQEEKVTSSEIPSNDPWFTSPMLNVLSYPDTAYLSGFKDPYVGLLCLI